LWFDGPLILSGSIATGEAVLAAEAMGADLAYIGSPFIATPEARCSATIIGRRSSRARRRHRQQRLVHRDAGNYLRSSIERSGLDPDALEKMESLPTDGSDGSSRSKAWRDIWGSGQGIGVIDKVQPAADYIARLREYDEARARLCAS
jgi:nitronate monooxygenase